MAGKKAEMQTVNYCKQCHSILNGRSSCQECEEAASVPSTRLRKADSTTLPRYVCLQNSITYSCDLFSVTPQLCIAAGQEMLELQYPGVVDDVTSGKEYAQIPHTLNVQG